MCSKAAVGRAAGRRLRQGLARLGPVLALAQCLTGLSLAAGAAELPPEVRSALQRARVPETALAVVVQEAGSGHTVLSHQARQPVNPASLVKLVTTYAALDLLGPAWTWTTAVGWNATLRDGVLDGDLFLKGGGDPKLVAERLWQGLRRLQQAGVREIRGDIVLDRSAFAPSEGSAADFDGDASRAYNVQPDALLINFHALTWSVTPDGARAVARITADAEPLGAAVRTVPLTGGPCEDWRAGLKPVVTDGTVRFTGSYPAACGEQSWPMADPDAAGHGARLIASQWKDLGGTLTGRVRDGRWPAGLRAQQEWRSPPLAEVVRDVNKFSNNVMAQQVFLTLAAQRLPGQPATPEAARETLRRWVAERMGEGAAGELVLDNGSGLSRQTRVTAQWLARLLQQAWSSPVMPELMSSLPVNGLDGTLRRSRAPAGRAHLKTGSLRDVVGLAGYVLDDSGRRRVLVAMIQHPNAQAARPALEALVQWALKTAPGR